MTAVVFQSVFAPDKDDDFGMGPFLSGLFLGRIPCVIAGVSSLAIGSRMRAVRPLQMRWLLVVERIVLVLPPTVVLATAAVFIVGGPIGEVAVCLAAVGVVLVALRCR